MRILGIVFLSLAVAACAKSERSDVPDTAAMVTNIGQQNMAFTLTSPAFVSDSIPSKYTCDGADVSPPLEWTGAPAATKSFALIIDDPDAPDPAKPQRVYVHWVVYNIPASTTLLPENAAKGGLPSVAVQGSNDWKKQTYGGPCPPIGRHRYFFKLYALDTVLSGLKNPNKAALEKAMQGHIISRAELIGRYQKTKK